MDKLKRMEELKGIANLNLIGVMGRSLGGLGTLLAAAEDARIRIVIALSLSVNAHEKLPKPIAVIETIARTIRLIFLKPSYFKLSPLYLANKSVIPRVMVLLTGNDIGPLGKGKSTIPMPDNTSPTIKEPRNPPLTNTK